ncbi:hypothetical protein [Moritella sp. F3]|uniref:hypothetical protein n=1 Tax=Moritella sp. F3 TaxID=2718882 RepID=UPI0018E177E9|nr:hypothetical protein [Moritella sp. F3]GIC77105.1 hypothetical protein FMO001_18320 [Moritella sp. F1]GIC82224.1 hypothetical protein FMO003_25050 [Moritella sp. F3]
MNIFKRLSTENLMCILGLVTAGGLTYLLMPYLLSFAGMPASVLFWNSPVSPTTAAIIILALVLFAIFINLVVKLEQHKNGQYNGGQDNDGIKWLVLVVVMITFGLASLAVALLVGITVFGVSLEVFTSFGVETQTAGLVALIITIITMSVYMRKA